jgi:hypothetical protein
MVVEFWYRLDPMPDRPAECVFNADHIACLHSFCKRLGVPDTYWKQHGAKGFFMELPEVEFVRLALDLQVVYIYIYISLAYI